MQIYQNSRFSNIKNVFQKSANAGIVFHLYLTVILTAAVLKTRGPLLNAELWFLFILQDVMISFLKMWLIVLNYNVLIVIINLFAH